MPYKDEYHPKVKSDLKRLDKPVVKEIHSIHLNNILSNIKYCLPVGRHGMGRESEKD